MVYKVKTRLHAHCACMFTIKKLDVPDGISDILREETWITLSNLTHAHSSADVMIKMPDEQDDRIFVGIEHPNGESTLSALTAQAGKFIKFTITCDIEGRSAAGEAFHGFTGYIDYLKSQL